MLEKQQRVREKRQVLQLSLFQNVRMAFAHGRFWQTDTAYAVASKMSLKK